MSTKYKRVLTTENLNPNLKALEFIACGPILLRAAEIEKEFEKGIKKPFDKIIKAHTGDCHAMGQIPITFFRQVLALVTYPPLLENPDFPDDAKERARIILSSCKGGSIGSYTDAVGIEVIRKHVAEYIEKRDGGIPCDWKDIVLSVGASDAVQKILKLFISVPNGKKTGVMIPIPQYPLYSATITEFGFQQIGYFLDELHDWGLDIDELQKSVDEARKTCNPRAIVVINPGNPTGQVLSRKNIEEIIKFAYKEKLFILADEVYQFNIYAEDAEFHSFKKVLMEMGDPYCHMELASFMSCSKGYMGECGLRGGYVEVINLCPEVKAVYFKSNTTNLCPTVLGQACMDVVVKPPEEGQPSYEKFIAEKGEILDSLKLKAKMVADAFNSFEGFSCNRVQGAMYAFPKVQLPAKAIDEAKKRNLAADMFYGLELLENTGICIVPGTGFGQQPGTFHFRTTILPQINELKMMLEKFETFHKEFLNKYK